MHLLHEEKRALRAEAEEAAQLEGTGTAFFLPKTAKKNHEGEASGKLPM